MKRLFAILLAGFMVFASGCAPASTQQEQGMRFYYCVSADNHTGPAVSHEFDLPETVAVETMLQRLFNGPHDATLSRTFPAGTHLLGWSLENNVLAVDLSEEFGGLSGISLRKAIYCVVLTLCQLEGVEQVTITVDGRQLPGVGADAMSADDVELKGEIRDPITVSSQLYFPLTDMSGLGLEYRVFEVADSSALAQANGVLKQLELGPKEEGMFAFLNNGGSIAAVNIREGVCVVALDGTALSSICLDDNVCLLYLYSIVDSLTEIHGIDAVSFMIEEIAVPGLEDSYSAIYEF